MSLIEIWIITVSLHMCGCLQQAHPGLYINEVAALGADFTFAKNGDGSMTLNTRGVLPSSLQCHRVDPCFVLLSASF